MLLRLSAIAAAGALGTLCRYGLGEGAKHLAGGASVWGTVLANVIGCLLFGLVVALSESRDWPEAEMRLILLAGFMGAFTTFSTFVFDSADLLRAGHLGYAALNALGQIAVGLGALFVGLSLGRWGA